MTMLNFNKSGGQYISMPYIILYIFVHAEIFRIFFKELEGCGLRQSSQTKK